MKTYQQRNIWQKTLKSTIHCVGLGLHCGRRIHIAFHPAAPDTGIVFKRSDVAGQKSIVRALWSHVIDTRLCTVVGNNDQVVVGTIEHLLAAFSGIGLDNVIVEVDGPEVPIMDGSSAPFVFLFMYAGICEQNVRRRVIRLNKTIKVLDGKRIAVCQPATSGLLISCNVNFLSQIVGQQTYSVDLNPVVFCREISRARTFGFLEEVTQMQTLGLARGGSLDNAVVISGNKLLNEEGLRFKDEFVRHKILDTIGDLYLLGRPLIGKFYGNCSGHTLNNQLLHALLENQESWDVEEVNVH